MQQSKKVDSFATSGLTNVPIPPPPVPARTQSPDALALAAEWWRVEEMGGWFHDLIYNPTGRKWLASYWGGPMVIRKGGPTPAAAVIAAHEAWQKEQGK